ncbi:pancreatic triacylglycerol lipase-like [Plodia interpunctella]|uniref:pancreatic triacylglycerol lipase-like n=1 Tax=Plodia interpunctella TaxID=58824 RepID=UPI0023688B8E|nr:pancreatic triacylglycerol lipase-like [Plodia interpunctella]
MMKIFLCLIFCFDQILAWPFSDCVEPPKECPNENITFWLYTRTNVNDPHELRINDKDTIMSAPWVQDAPIKVLIHGYTGHKDYSPNTEIRPAYMKCCNYNIISVDYKPLAQSPCYPAAARNTELVGMCTAQLIDDLIQTYNFDLARFHVIGFSLGGQTAGHVGKNIQSGALHRITGLDPALPLFVTQNSGRKLNAGDANFVDVLHTNALERGKLESCGDIDFYANGGLTQPGCHDTANQSRSSCDHARAPVYYAESINSDVGFYGTRCYSWISYMIGWCELVDSNEEVLYGEHMLLNISGLYFFPTNSDSPYAKGPNKRQTRR